MLFYYFFTFFIFSDDSSDENIDEQETLIDCNYVKIQNPNLPKVLGPNDIAQTLVEGPTQPKLKCYPKTVYGVGKTKRLRSFNSSWYDQFNWIEYSKIDDSVYCFPCRLFSFKSSSDLTFINVGYKNWKNAMSCKGFIRHDNTSEHKQCVSLVRL